MTRVQFLNDLCRRLNGLSQEQVEQHLTYYAEMLADRMEEGMSEEEAVASMEPLDTIVQRILEDTPPEERSPQPPVYPDLPQTDGSRFSKVPDSPARRGRKNLARIALWVLAITVAIASVSARLFRAPRHYDTTSIAEETPPAEQAPAVDHGVALYEAEALEGIVNSFGPGGIDVPGAHIGPDGIFASSEEVEIFGQGLDYTPADIHARFAVVNDTYVVSPYDILAIDIRWTTGAVQVCSWDGDMIQFQELADSTLPESRKLEYSTDGSTLVIDDNVSAGKGLLVQVPYNWMEELSIGTTTADVTLENLFTLGLVSTHTSTGNITVLNGVAQSFAFYGSSGSIALQGVAANEIEIELTSGDLFLNGVAASSMDASLSSGNISGFTAAYDLELTTTSGNISLSAAGLGETSLDSSSGDIDAVFPQLVNCLEIETTSGDVALTLPPELGFTLEFDTASGYLDRGSFELVRSDGMYVAQNGNSVFIEVQTSSGDLDLRPL